MSDEALGKNQLLWGVARVFRPGTPVNKYSLFSGRREQVADVINAVNQQGQHVVLFGERGVGKTSLANIINEVFEGVAAGLNSRTVNCDRRDDFASIWRKTFRELSVVDSDGIATTLDTFLGETVTPEDVRHLLGYLDETIVILDEVDVLQDSLTKELLADTIKTLADHASNATLILVGVADSVDELISHHQSLERSLVQVRMPRMSEAELFEIIDNGALELQMTISEPAMSAIAARSFGLPHFTHLLSLHAFQRAVGDDRDNVTQTDVIEATSLAVKKVQQSVLSAHHRAVSSQQKETLHEKVLLACALANTDALGFFAARDVRDPLSKIAGKRYDTPAFSRHLNEFTTSSRGPILQRTGQERRYRFRFVNPLMQPYIIMRGLEDGLIQDADIVR
ncbi:AAA family ATPase [Nocardia fluminea]|uniref:nSTAND1 domain-containing NTPase n=1 Tax=Nocardia fluminea TaxID=134984 RepID=UPI0033FCD03E